MFFSGSLSLTACSRTLLGSSSMLMSTILFNSKALILRSVNKLIGDKGNVRWEFVICSWLHFWC